MNKNAFVIGQSAAFLDAVEQASRAAGLNRSVLVIGERGTGKELIAERLHRLSSRWSAPLVTINCAALPENLIEAELFGYEIGAFTGATRAKAGRFEQADSGTLFLDELATLSLSAQERLLRAVEYGEISRIGASRSIHVDVRIVAATNEDLPSLAETGRFRADLLDRLSFEVITLPPLRARKEDIHLLADHFGRRMASELEWQQWLGFSKKATEILTSYNWPGNIRELRNVIERSLYRWNDENRPVDTIILDPFASPWRPHHIKKLQTDIVKENPVSPSQQASSPLTQLSFSSECSDLRTACQAYECHLLEKALQQHHYNQRATAQALQLSYDQLRHLLKRHNLLSKERDLSKEKPNKDKR
ncbi:MAG: phage shock protein operon transcriptional activator [Zymomonas mobilis subsp. pomaceae]|uniref:phage shock protein operon transcriptional activator n=1 Tax=Zymomonas mobilis TaxID=542 RepID=UPI0039EA967C